MWEQRKKKKQTKKKTSLDSATGGCTPSSILNGLAAHSRRSDLGLGLVKRVSLLVVVLVDLTIEYPGE